MDEMEGTYGMKKKSQTLAKLLLQSLRKEAKQEKYLREEAIERLDLYGESRAADNVRSHLIGRDEVKYQEFKAWCERWLSSEAQRDAGLILYDDVDAGGVR